MNYVKVRLGLLLAAVMVWLACRSDTPKNIVVWELYESHQTKTTMKSARSVQHYYAYLDRGDWIEMDISSFRLLHPGDTLRCQHPGQGDILFHGNMLNAEWTGGHFPRFGE
jgi:hypothetical protein